MKNAKRYLFAAIPIIFVFLIICGLFAMLTQKTIPLADGLRFGMSPKQATKVLGEHIEVEFDAGGTGKSVYTHKAKVLDQDAVVTCYFLNDNQLTEVVFRWETSTKELYNQVYTCVYDHYHDKKDFFVKNENTSDSETKRTSLGIDNGATGIFYTLYETSTLLEISCIDLS